MLTTASELRGESGWAQWVKRLVCHTCEWWTAAPAAALLQQRPSAAAGKALCGSWGEHCRSLAPPATRTWGRRSWTALQKPASLWNKEREDYQYIKASPFNQTCQNNKRNVTNDLLTAGVPILQHVVFLTLSASAASCLRTSPLAGCECSHQCALGTWWERWPGDRASARFVC